MIGRIYNITNHSARQIAIAYGLHPQTVTYLLNKRLNIKPTKTRRINLYYLNNHVFDIIDEKSAYWLGFLYADGCVSKGGSLVVNISPVDREHLYSLKFYLEAKNPIYEFPDKYPNGGIQLNIRDRYLANRLSELGIVPRRTEFHRLLNNLPDNMIKHFVRGDFDGDGHRRKLGRTGLLFSGTLDLLEWIRSTTANQIGTNPNISIRKNGNSLICYRLEYGSKSDYDAIDQWMYGDASVYLARKRFQK
jgi:hypothetical protein